MSSKLTFTKCCEILANSVKATIDIPCGNIVYFCYDDEFVGVMLNCEARVQIIVKEKPIIDTDYSIKSNIKMHENSSGKIVGFITTKDVKSEEQLHLPCIKKIYMSDGVTICMPTDDDLASVHTHSIKSDNFTI